MNCLIETALLSTHNICLGWEIRKKNQLGTLISGGLNRFHILYISGEYNSKIELPHTS